MRMATPVIVAVAVLGLALGAPARAEWILEVRDTYFADRKGQPHPCCPTVEIVLEEAETPALLCVYYSNNFKKKDKGRVRLRSEAHGLDSGAFLGQWQATGWVQDREWLECVYLGAAQEPCLVDFEFSLVGLPRMKKKPRRTDGFMVGVFAMPDAKAADNGSLEELRGGRRDLPSYQR